MQNLAFLDSYEVQGLPVTLRIPTQINGGPPIYATICGNTARKNNIPLSVG